jgi:hypothetical protein
VLPPPISRGRCCEVNNSYGEGVVKGVVQGFRLCGCWWLVLGGRSRGGTS